MNRRSFLSGVLLACAAPGILLRKAPDGFKWAKSSQILIPNGKFIVDFKYALKWEYPELMEALIFVRDNCFVG